MMTISRRLFDSEHADARAHPLPLRACNREVKMQAAEALAQKKYGKGWTEL